MIFGNNNPKLTHRDSRKLTHPLLRLGTDSESFPSSFKNRQRADCSNYVATPDRLKFLLTDGIAVTVVYLKIATNRVAEIFGIEKEQVVVAGKQPDRVRARNVPASWAIRDPGLTATEVGKYLSLSKSAVSRAATIGQKLIVDQCLSLKD